jgi:hypothetical protein
MKISPFSDEPLANLADQLGWADHKEAYENLLPVVMILCNRVHELQQQVKSLQLDELQRYVKEGREDRDIGRPAQPTDGDENGAG